MKRHPVAGCVDVIRFVLEYGAKTVVLLDASPERPFAMFEESSGECSDCRPLLILITGQSNLTIVSGSTGD